jgi:hypothetical protein
MGIPGAPFSVPLPPPPPRAQASAGAGEAGRLVADFLSATQALSCEAAAELAGVRTETIRKWRRRLPRWLKEATSRRMAACLAGEPPPDREAGFQRSFRRVLRSAPGAEDSRRAPADAGIPP